MKFIKLLAIFMIGYASHTYAATVENEESPNTPRVSLINPAYTPAGKEAPANFEASFETDDSQIHKIRTVVESDKDGISKMWHSIQHKSVTSEDRLETVLKNQLQRLKNSNPYAWMVIEKEEKEAAELQAVLMIGRMPTKAGYNKEDPEHAELLKVFTETCGVDYEGVDPKDGNRKDNQGLATMAPAFPQELLEERGSRPQRFLMAGVEAIRFLKNKGLKLPLEDTVPSAIVSVFDPNLCNVQQGSGAEVIMDSWVKCMVDTKPAEGKEDTRPARHLAIHKL